MVHVDLGKLAVPIVLALVLELQVQAAKVSLYDLLEAQAEQVVDLIQLDLPVRHQQELAREVVLLHHLAQDLLHRQVVAVAAHHLHQVVAHADHQEATDLVVLHVAAVVQEAALAVEDLQQHLADLALALVAV